MNRGNPKPGEGQRRRLESDTKQVEMRNFEFLENGERLKLQCFKKVRWEVGIKHSEARGNAENALLDCRDFACIVTYGFQRERTQWGNTVVARVRRRRLVVTGHRGKVTLLVTALRFTKLFFFFPSPHSSRMCVK